MDDAGGSADFRSSACAPFLNAFAAEFIFLIFLFDQLSSITAQVSDHYNFSSNIYSSKQCRNAFLFYNKCVTFLLFKDNLLERYKFIFNIVLFLITD